MTKIIYLSLGFPDLTKMKARIQDTPENSDTVQKYAQSLQKELAAHSVTTGEPFDTVHISHIYAGSMLVGDAAIVTPNSSINMAISFDTCKECFRYQRRCLLCPTNSATTARSVFMNMYYPGNQK